MMLRLEQEIEREMRPEMATSAASSGQMATSAASSGQMATTALIPAHRLEAAYRRHTKYRRLYGDVAHELARQVSSK